MFVELKAFGVPTPILMTQGPNLLTQLALKPNQLKRFSKSSWITSPMFFVTMLAKEFLRNVSLMPYKNLIKNGISQAVAN